MNTKITQAVSFVVLSLLLLANLSLLARNQPALGAEERTAAAAVSPLLQYQGRLSDPQSGEPMADGSYIMVFRLYAEAAGGAPLWTETKDVAVAGGLFSTLLGDVSTLDQDFFNGQALWLGIKVGTDEEAAPRQQIVPVAYALGLVPGASISAKSPSASLTVANSGSGPALKAGGKVVVTGDLNVEGSLEGGSHSHPGYVTQYEMDDHIYGGMHNGRYIAAGVIEEQGTIASATSNVSSKWSSLHKAYEITIDGVSYDHWSYVTVVTPIVGGFASAWSGSGKLYVGIYDTETNPVKQPFQFVVFQP